MAAAGASVSPLASGRRSGLVNLAWLMGDKLAALLLGLVIQGLIARSHGPGGTGHFAYAMVLLQLTLGLSMVCAGVALLPRFCRARRVVPGALIHLFVLRLLASLAAVALMGLFCLATIGDPQRLWVSLLLVATVPLIEPFYLFATYWQSRNHNRPTVLARSFGLVLRTALVALGDGHQAACHVRAVAVLADPRRAGRHGGLAPVPAEADAALPALRAALRARAGPAAALHTDRPARDGRAPERL